MACKHCGETWSKDVTDEEMTMELTRREKERARIFAQKKTEAEVIRKEYMAKEWPTSEPWVWLAGFNFALTILGAYFFVGFMGDRFEMLFGPGGVFILLLTTINVGVFFMLPAIYVLCKASRLWASFTKEYPEHVKVLAQS